MNLDELKTAWKVYDQKLAASAVLREKLVRSMIRERSGSVLAKIRRKYLFHLLLVAALSAFCALSIFYNAFDYTHPVQHVSLVLYLFASLLIGFLILKAYPQIQVDLSQDHLAGALRKASGAYAKAEAARKKVGMLVLLAGFLYPVTMLPRIIENRGLVAAVGVVGGTLAFIVGLLLLFRYLGFFRDPQGDSLNACLQELEDLNRPERKEII